MELAHSTPLLEVAADHSSPCLFHLHLFVNSHTLLLPLTAPPIRVVPPPNCALIVPFLSNRARADGGPCTLAPPPTDVVPLRFFFVLLAVSNSMARFDGAPALPSWFYILLCGVRFGVVLDCCVAIVSPVGTNLYGIVCIWSHHPHPRQKRTH